MSQASAPRAFAAIVKRDLRVAQRRRAELLNPLLFFVIVVSLFPMALGPERELLEALAPGVVWVAALLATLLALDSMFRTDFEDGSLEQMVLSPHPLTVLVIGKVLAHWLVTGLPLLLLAPVLGILVALPEHATPTLLATLALGTPVLSLVGAIGVALTVGLRRGGALLSLLVLPLYVPVLIFGTHAVDAAGADLPVRGQLYALGALLLLALSLAPLAIAAALRITTN